MIARKLPAPLALLLVLVVAVGGCGSDSDDEARAERAARAAPPGSAQAGEASADADESDLPLVVFLGDSLTAGYGLPGDSAYPAVIARTLRDEGRPIRIVNAGSSGDTSAGGLSRLPWLLKQHPDVLVVGLGGNDGLRGLPPSSTRKNLEQIIRKAKEQDVPVLLLGMRMPPNYGPEYTAEFEGLYKDLADELDVSLVPFMLEGVGGHRDLNQGDGIHPTAEGQQIVAANVLPALRALLDSAE